MFKKMKIVTKVNLIVILGFLIITFVLELNQYKVVSSFAKKYVEKNVQKRVKSLVDSELLALNAYYYKMKSDGFSDDKIKKNLMEFISKSKYGKAGYFWINDFNGTMIEHPTKKLKGANLINLQDKNGLYIIKETIKVAKEKGEGFVNYYWPVPGKDEPQLKISYVKVFKPYKWIIGTGEYYQNIKKEIENEALWVDKFEKKEIVKGILITVVFTTFIIVALLTFFRKSFINPLNSLKDKILKIKDNYDLTINLDTSRQDELGIIQKALKDLVNSFSKIITNIKNNAVTVSSASTELSSTAEELSATSEEQAAQSASVASAMEELTATIEDNQRMTESSSDKVREMVEITNQSSEAMAKTIDSIVTISEKSAGLSGVINEFGESAKGIGEILKVIIDISDQTNLLALNAAIEAARAGEAGRGFAVVADEIRKLAERTAKSIKEIEDITKNIQKRAEGAVIAMDESLEAIEQGVRLAEESREMLDKIISSSREVQEITTAISTATTEQAATVKEVNLNVQGIAQGTEQSLQAISQIAITANDLATQAEQLKEEVEKFKV